MSKPRSLEQSGAGWIGRNKAPSEKYAANVRNRQPFQKPKGQTLAKLNGKEPADVGRRP